MIEKLHVLYARIRALLDRRAADLEFDDEAVAHLELLTDRFVNQGLAKTEARQAALRQFGGVSQLKENLRDERSHPVFEAFIQDVTWSARQMRTAPRFTLATAAILGLGLGACFTVFTVVNAVLLRPLPYADAGQLVWIGEVLKRNTTDEVTLTPSFLEWRQKNTVFTSMAAYNVLVRTLLAKDGAFPLRTAKASAALLPILRSQPALGRGFLPGEDLKGQDRVALLSFGVWQRAFGGDASIVGRWITLDDGTYEVVGVMPRDFSFPALGEIDLITPLGKNESAELTRAGGAITIVRNVIARLKPGMSLQQARSEMEVIEANLGLPSFLHGGQISVKVSALQDRFTSDVRFSLVALLCAGGFMLLLICANVANLMLGRAESRRKELAIRAALGASRNRILGQLLVESCSIAALGCGIGSSIALLSRRALLSVMPQSVPGLHTLPFDLQVTVFAISCAIATVIAFGVVPAFYGSNAQASAALASEGRSMAGGIRLSRWLNLLAAGQTALAIVLLVGGLLMLESFWNLRYKGLSFNTANTVTATVDLNPLRFKTASAQALFLDAISTRLRGLPGVEEVGFGALPPGEGHATNGFAIEGRQPLAQGQRSVARQYVASPGYFRMLGLAILAGREFEYSDTGGATAVTVVNEAFARSNFPSEDPIGRRIRAEPTDPWRTIVGVVREFQTAGLGKPAEPAFFVPYAQAGYAGGGGVGFLIQTALDAGSIGPAIRSTVTAVDARQAVTRIETLDQRLDESVAQPRLAAALLGTFAALGLVLAGTGLYSVMFVLVRSRFREIGIRLALGGRSGDIVLMILKSGLRVMCAGIVIGVCGAVWLGRVLQSMWHGVSPTDPPTLLGATGILLLVGLAAASGPARRAARVDPADTLRND